jgi:tRNA 2-selenouridine synthase
VAQLREFTDIIDVRTPDEYALDHVPDAQNAPVLDNAERAAVGTLHKQESPFAAKRYGAALVARNIATHLLERYQHQPRDWAPLIYCWRGGNRSGAMVTIFNRIGWRAVQLEGGYQAYRRDVLAQLETLPGTLHYRVICGVTGSGKSRLLRALAAEGAQVLDLEDLAKHKGSVLGHDPTEAQPAQKMFDSLVLRQLQGFDANRPVFVEAESKKVGAVQVPDALMQAMRASPCVRVELSTAHRVALLKEEYEHFLRDPARLNRQLDCLTDLHGKAVITGWKDLSLSAQWDTLVEDLLHKHYDRAYETGMARNYRQYGEAALLQPAGIGVAEMRAVARRLVVG